MIAFGTVIYLGALEYLDEFVSSLNEQTFHDFDLLIVNDNVNRQTLNECLSSLEINCIIIDCYEKKSPADLRVDLINEAKLKDYELLILGDCDDLFDKKRVLELVNYYKNNNEYSFYYNNLLLFDNTKALKDFPTITDNIDQILECNFLGLSNTSINLSQISIPFINTLYGCTSFVFDWYLYSRMVCNGAKGAYVEKAITYYRVYDNNFAGVSNEKQLKKEFEIKNKHFELMEKYNSIYIDLQTRLLGLDISKIKPNNSLSYWWNNIKL